MRFLCRALMWFMPCAWSRTKTLGWLRWVLLIERRRGGFDTLSSCFVQLEWQFLCFTDEKEGKCYLLLYTCSLSYANTTFHSTARNPLEYQFAFQTWRLK